MTAQSLETSITIKAPRAKVFAAWTKPELMRNWFAPGPMTVASVSADPRPGGKYSITMQGKDASPTVTGEYQEVVTNEKLVFTWGWEGDPSQKTLVTILFRDTKEGTEVALKHKRFADVAARDKHRQGWDGCLAKLDQALAP
jgi:uncharacterized protein YndB with AHSA1/START domain